MDISNISICFVTGMFFGKNKPDVPPKFNKFGNHDFIIEKKKTRIRAGTNSNK